MFVPIKISEHYFDFFSQNTPDYFRQSFLRLFGFESPYPSITYYISQIYEGSSSNSNNGLIADAMTNLGYIGIIVFPILLCIIFRLLDNSSVNIDSHIGLLSAIFVAMELSNTFLMRVLFTHGLIVLIIVMRLFEKEDQEVTYMIT